MPVDIVKITLTQILTEFAAAAAEAVAYEQWTPEFGINQIKLVWADSPGTCRKRRAVEFGIADFKKLSPEELVSFGFRRFDDTMWLIPLWLFNYISNGEPLRSISGAAVGKSASLDLDTRAGCIAYGFTL